MEVTVPAWDCISDSRSRGMTRITTTRRRTTIPRRSWRRPHLRFTSSGKMQRLSRRRTGGTTASNRARTTRTRKRARAAGSACRRPRPHRRICRTAQARSPALARGRRRQPAALLPAGLPFLFAVLEFRDGDPARQPPAIRSSWCTSAPRLTGSPNGRATPRKAVMTGKITLRVYACRPTSAPAPTAAR